MPILVEEIIKQKKISRIIFLGAAFLTQSKLFISLNDDEIDTLMETNIINYIRLTRLILPFMLKLKGNIIYLSSFRSNTTSRGISLYAVSKAFGERFFELIGKEYGALGVYSSSIRMGYFDGRMTTRLDDSKVKSIKLNAGNRKLGTSADLLRSIDFIIENPYTNGGTIDLTGGINHEF